MYVRVPVPVPAKCPVCPKCQVIPGIIAGCIKGCCGNSQHKWEVKLFERYKGKETFRGGMQVCDGGDFEFTVPFEGCYILRVRMCGNCCKPLRCKPSIVINNMGVESFMIE